MSPEDCQILCLETLNAYMNVTSILETEIRRGEHSARIA